MEDMKTRVERGASLMDKLRPGWHNEIDIKRLNFFTLTNCILGQTVGFFTTLPDTPEGQPALEYHGFGMTPQEARHDSAFTPEVAAEFYANHERLKDHWVTAIAERAERWTQHSTGTVESPSSVPLERTEIETETTDEKVAA